MAYYYFSAIASPDVAGEQVSEIPELEDISEEEAEMARAEKSKRYNSKGGKVESAPKVILTLLCCHLSFYLFFL